MDFAQQQQHVICIWQKRTGDLIHFTSNYRREHGLTFPNTAIRVRSIYGNFIMYLGKKTHTVSYTHSYHLKLSFKIAECYRVEWSILKLSKIGTILVNFHFYLLASLYYLFIILTPVFTVYVSHIFQQSHQVELCRISGELLFCKACGWKRLITGIVVVGL